MKIKQNLPDTSLPRAKPGTPSAGTPVTAFPTGFLSIHTAPTRRGGFSDAIRHRGNGTGAVPYDIKNPPFPMKRGISYQNCSSQYAERMLATGREVLLDLNQVKSVRHEFVSSGSLLKTHTF